MRHSYEKFEHQDYLHLEKDFIYKVHSQLTTTNKSLSNASIAQDVPTMLTTKAFYFPFENLNYCLRTLFELNTKLSSPARVELSLPAAQPLLIARTAARAGSPATRLPSTCFSNSGRPFAFLSFLLFLSSSLSFLSHCSTVLCRNQGPKWTTNSTSNLADNQLEQSSTPMLNK